MGIAYAAEHWADFGVATTGAAAALAGLLFVAISINIERILQFPGLPHRAAQTLILFALPLVTALLLIVPGQPRAALGGELLVIGLATGTFMLVTDARVPLSEQETRIDVAVQPDHPGHRDLRLPGGGRGDAARRERGRAVLARARRAGRDHLRPDQRLGAAVEILR